MLCRLWHLSIRAQFEQGSQKMQVRNIGSPKPITKRKQLSWQHWQQAARKAVRHSPSHSLLACQQRALSLNLETIDSLQCVASSRVGTKVAASGIELLLTPLSAHLESSWSAFVTQHPCRMSSPHMAPGSSAPVWGHLLVCHLASPQSPGKCSP